MTVQALRDLGHDVRDIRGTPIQGSGDNILWDIAQGEERLLISTDMGFSRHRNLRHAGILIVRLKQPNRQKIHKRALQAMVSFKVGEWSDLLVVIEDRIQRIWRARQRLE